VGGYAVGLKNLSKAADSGSEAFDPDAAAQAFISGAPVTAGTAARKKRPGKTVYVRTTFSLSKSVNRKIDKLSLAPRNFKVSRSDVVRAGIIALGNLERAELLELLEQVSKSEPIQDDDLMQDE
jgi:Arc/MetJ-type ribon-helix-helix transcriptional regulator